MSTKTSKRVFDVLVVGGGSAGLTAAKLAGHTLGASCLLIENERLGGDCTWTGCVPSKTLIAAAKSFHAARPYLPANAEVDVNAVRERLRRNTKKIYERDDSAEALGKLGVSTMAGRATLTSSRTLRVDLPGESAAESVELEAARGIILCTGATARIPNDVPGLDSLNYWTYESVWDLEALPAKLTVVGGGPIGCELAQALSRLGCQVSVIARRLLPREDPAAGQVLERVFESEGITLCRGRLQKVESVGNDKEKHVATYQHSNGETETVEGDKLLLAMGRVPRCQDMGLEDMGVVLTDEGGIQVNAKLQTSVKGVFAAGDCTGDRQFTHYAGYQGAIAARNILLPLSDPGVLEHVPATTFTSPEVASLGLTAQQAIDKYGSDRVVVAEQHLSEVDRAVCDGAEDGFIKIVYQKRGGKILGATIVAPAAGEMISEIAVAQKAGLPFDQLTTVMHPYPSYAIAIQLMAADAYYEKTLRFKWLYDILKMLGL